MMAPSRGMAGWMAINCLFEFLAGAEGHLLAGLDLDRFAGIRIASHAGNTISHLQNPESDNLHALAQYQVLGDYADEVFHQLQSLTLAESMLFPQLIGQMLDGDRLWGRRLLCRCDVKHGRLLLCALCAIADGDDRRTAGSLKYMD